MMNQANSTYQRSSALRALFTVVAVLWFASSTAAQSLPLGWTAGDIGSPAISGTASSSGTTFTVSGAGSDVWGTRDQFMFVRRSMTGDGTIVARVASIQNIDPWVKAGVMMRESLTAGSRQAFALVSPGKGAAFQRRTSTDGSSTSTAASGAPPLWVRLQRSGSTFTASSSTNGTSWTTIGSQTISMGSTIYVGLAVSSHKVAAAASVIFSSVDVADGEVGTAAPLPSGWSSRDIGTIRSGTSSYASSVFTVDAAGSDIWGSSDQFRYTYRLVTGDVDIVARVTAIEDVDDWSKAGVMIRRSLASNAGHASMFVSSQQGLAFQRRPSDGASSVHTSGGAYAAPRWVRLTRRGSVITAYQSSTGTTWTTVGTQSLTLPTSFYVGLAVTSHNPLVLSLARFSNVSVTAPTTPPPPPPTNQLPTVSLTAPTAGAAFNVGATVSIAATASDTDGTIAGVDFLVDGALVRTDTTSPYTATWTAAGAGAHSITAVARDDDGGSRTSTARSITVNGSAGNTSPIVALTAPAANATFTAGASITISATASDPGGSVASVTFYAGQTLIETADTSSPYSRTWTNVPAGTYSLTAVARDNAGATTVSSARTITVSGASMPTTAVFTPSSNHATAVTRYVVDIFTAGANPALSNPVASHDIGKPAIVNGEIRADLRQTITALSPGAYISTITAIGSGGSTRSAASPQFTR